MHEGRVVLDVLGVHVEHLPERDRAAMVVDPGSCEGGLRQAAEDVGCVQPVQAEQVADHRYVQIVIEELLGVGRLVVGDEQWAILACDSQHAVRRREVGVPEMHDDLLDGPRAGAWIVLWGRSDEIGPREALDKLVQRIGLRDVSCDSVVHVGS